jgi:hypothetical protein
VARNGRRHALRSQVHAAVLAGSGKEVVVKVVKPGTSDIISADLNAVRGGATGRACRDGPRTCLAHGSAVASGWLRDGWAFGRQPL